MMILLKHQMFKNVYDIVVMMGEGTLRL